MIAAIPTALSTHRLSISGMSCAGCVATVENALKNVPGVVESTVNFAEHTATVRGSVDAKALIAAVTASEKILGAIREQNNGEKPGMQGKQELENKVQNDNWRRSPSQIAP